MTTSEVAKILGISDSHVGRMAKCAGIKPKTTNNKTSGWRLEYSGSDLIAIKNAIVERNDPNMVRKEKKTWTRFICSDRRPCKACRDRLRGKGIHHAVTGAYNRL